MKDIEFLKEFGTLSAETAGQRVPAAISEPHCPNLLPMGSSLHKIPLKSDFRCQGPDA
jgi:hypothetical protein